MHIRSSTGNYITLASCVEFMCASSHLTKCYSYWLASSSVSGASVSFPLAGNLGQLTPFSSIVPHTHTHSVNTIKVNILPSTTAGHALYIKPDGIKIEIIAFNCIMSANRYGFYNRLAVFLFCPCGTSGPAFLLAR